MLSKTWETSEKKYNLRVEQNVRIRVTDGTEINADIFHPDSNEKFPAIFWFSPYFLAPQRASVTPEAISTHDLMVKRNMKIVYKKENEDISEMFRGNENIFWLRLTVGNSTGGAGYRYLPVR